MSKELEALDSLYYSCNDLKKLEQAYKFLKNYLEAIDNANPSEALECLEKIVDKGRINAGSCCHWRECLSKNKCILHNNDLMCDDYTRANTINQALLKLDFLEDAMDLPTNCFSSFKNRNGDEVTIMRRERYEEYQEQENILKILKEKKVELMSLYLSSSVEQYNSQFVSDENKLTQEEFDLLKRYICQSE